MIHTIVVGQFSKMLGNLLAILTEAEKYAAEKKFDVAVLLQSRLSPDQFNLIQQVQTACDTAKLGAARLAGTEKDAPVQADTEATLLVLDREALRRLTEQNPRAAAAFFQALVQVFIERLRASGDLVAEVTRWGLEATGLDMDGR